MEDEGHQVHLAYVPREDPPTPELNRYWGCRLHTLPYHAPRSRRLQFRRRLGRWIGIDSWCYNLPVDAWYDTALDGALERLVRKHRFDILVVHYVFLSRAFLRVGPHLRKILITHDVFTDRFRRYLEEGLTPQWFSTSQSQEALGLNRADVVVALQEEEASYFRNLTRRPVWTLGHPIPIVPQPWTAATPGRILMVGSRNPLNVSAARTFLSRVLPAVREHVPHAHLAVAGTLGEALDAKEGVVRLGRLEDLKPAYAAASAVVIPVTAGTGLKIKLVEALGHGRPVIATRHAASGLACPPGKEPCLCTDGLQSMADALAEVLQDPVRARSLARAGLQFAEAWNRQCRKTVRRLLARPNATA